MANSWASLFGPGGKAIVDATTKGSGSGVDPYGALNPEQKAITQQLGPQIQSELGKSAQDYMYGGQLSAGITPGEQDVVGQNARMNAIAGNTYGQLANYNDPNFDQQFDTEITNPTLQNFTRNIQPLLEESLPSFSTARGNVISRNLGDLQNNLLQQRYAARGAAKDRALSALSGSNNYFQGAANIQSIPREIQQAGLDRQYQNFVTANSQKQNSLQNALSFLGLSTGTYQQPPDNLSRLLNIAKTGVQVAGLFNPATAPFSAASLGSSAAGSGGINPGSLQMPTTNGYGL